MRTCHDGVEAEILRLQLNRVPFELIIKSGALDPKKLCRFLLIPMTLGQRLENGAAFHFIQALNALSRSGALTLLQGGRQLHLGGQFFDANNILAGKDNSILHAILQLANVTRP